MQCARDPETNVRGIFNKASERAASKSMSCLGGGGDRRNAKKVSSDVAAAVPFRMLQGVVLASVRAEMSWTSRAVWKCIPYRATVSHEVMQV
jgi:hypothetical protein